MPTAAQLVYTNVEQERSPHRRRGFQLWLWSKALPKPVLDEVEQRVNTFARLTTAEAASLREKEKVPRRIFAPLVSGGWVMLAEAVPLENPDKFGRGGRFHAHALLFDRAGFEAAGADPFALFDAGFPFQRDPDVKELVDVCKGWEKSADGLPRVELTPVVRPASPLPDKLRPLVRELVGWLLGGPPTKTVALPVWVDETEVVLREVMRLLPPPARLRCGFDTLWTGRGKYPPAVCGAGSSALLQAWPFRQFVRLEAERKPATTLPAADEHKRLADWWVATPHLTDADRECGRVLVEWVAGRGELPPDATAAAVEWARGLPGVDGRWAGAVAAGVEAAFPKRVLDLPGVQGKAEAYFGGWGQDGVKKLADGIVTADRVRWVSEVVFADPPPALDAGTAWALYQWRANDKSGDARKLCMAAARWVAEAEPRAFVRAELTARPDDDWFHKYCWRTLPREWHAPGAAGRLVADAGRLGGPLPADAETYEAVCTNTTEDGPDLDQLRLLLRFQDRLGGRPAAFLREKPHLLGWAAEFVLPRVAGEVRYVALSEPNTTAHDEVNRLWGQFFGHEKHPLALLGVRLPPAGDGGGGLLSHFAQLMKTDFLPHLDRRFDPHTFPQIITEPTGVAKERGWKDCQAAYKRKDEAKLAEALAAASDDAFRRMANDHLFARVNGWHARGDVWEDGGYFVGAAVALSDEKQREFTLPLFRALVGSVTPFARSGTEAQNLPSTNPHGLHRLGWLVARLLHPSTTELRGIPDPATPQRDAP